jgi:3-dehydroquinate synthase
MIMTTIQAKFNLPYTYQVVFTRDAFNPENRVISTVLGTAGKANRVLVVIDSNVVATNPALLSRIEAYAEQNSQLLDIAGAPFIMTGGERCKQGPEEVEKIHALVNAYHLCRHSFVMVVGGGAVLDAAGYAVATAHRGLRLLRLPTTTLAQNDAGIGVKNAINKFGRKNFCGTFAPPYAVINDFDLLDTLSARDLRAGIAEAVKVALIKDRSFFNQLYDHRITLGKFEPSIMESMIIKCAQLHLDHIQNSGDPFENGSSRPLDFGHWAAHKIEDLAQDDIRHGEAVAIGIALDALYAYHKNMITEIERHKILSLLEQIGFTLFHPVLKKMDMAASLKEFQEHLGGRLTIPLIKGIGNLVQVHEIDTRLLDQCVAELSEKYKPKGKSDEKRTQPNAGNESAGNVLS